MSKPILGTNSYLTCSTRNLHITQ
ncbi:hypothetical protein F383_33255 [Gossypium arboreum]|uniref:Uncharacterized protein n=1 Tax=Gossypium arboreum TaxID=29729 RepID=A0A0B0PIT1_GOSAR|nr:hypothetical protein F383_33255 [Gossypium arboreum]